MTEKNVDSVEAEATVISVCWDDQAINDEKVVEIVMNYGETTKTGLIADQWKILDLATHSAENSDDTLGLATGNDIAVTTAIQNDVEKDRLSGASEYHYSAKRTQHCVEITARSELVEQL